MDIIMAIALWCGYPYALGFTSSGRGNVNECRELILKCVKEQEMKAAGSISGPSFRSCFEKAKLQ